MSTIKLNAGDYIQDPHGQYRFAMVTRNISIDTVSQMYAQIPLVWVDEHLSGLSAFEKTVSILVPEHLDMAPVEDSVLFSYMETLLDEFGEKMFSIIFGEKIVSFDPTEDQGYDEGDVSRHAWEKE